MKLPDFLGSPEGLSPILILLPPIHYDKLGKIPTAQLFNHLFTYFELLEPLSG